MGDDADQPRRLDDHLAHTAPVQGSHNAGSRQGELLQLGRIDSGIHFEAITNFPLDLNHAGHGLRSEQRLIAHPREILVGERILVA